MGITFSAFKVALQSFPNSVAVYTNVLKRISTSPGLPVANPTVPFWTKNRTLPDISLSDELPNYADVVIIGSGITGAAVAHTLLTRSDEFQSIVMLDSRSICDGASSRNGGHCKGETWGDYATLRKKYGEEAAQRIQKFRRTSLKDLLEIDHDYCNAKGDVRQVETLDGFYTDGGWKEAKENLEIWREAMGETGERDKYTHEIWEGEEAQQEWNLSRDCKGVIWSTRNVGLANPYGFVVGLLHFLTSTYAKRFQILAHTSVTSIESPKSQLASSSYVVSTSRGAIRTPRIIHATNAHVSHLVPSLRSRVIPVRLHLSAQRPGVDFLPTLKAGMRSWNLYWGPKYGYLSQLPRGSDHWGDGELIYGGGGSFAPHNGTDEVGNTDESTLDPQVASYISGALPVYFGEKNWGAEGSPSEGEEGQGFGRGRVKTMWAGIMGLSVDGPPWVGKLTRKLTPREIIPEGGGEWVSAGYSGEGLVHAWGCGRACAMSVLDVEDRKGEELPEEFIITEARVRKSGSAEQIFATLEEP